jgi:hypothetical protein
VDGLHRGRATREEYERHLGAAGLVEVRETHRVHRFAGSAIVRARKPRADAP